MALAAMAATFSLGRNTEGKESETNVPENVPSWNCFLRKYILG